jgi:hypothetical protein
VRVELSCGTGIQFSLNHVEATSVHIFGKLKIYFGTKLKFGSKKGVRTEQILHLFNENLKTFIAHVFSGKLDFTVPWIACDRQHDRGVCSIQSNRHTHTAGLGIAIHPTQHSTNQSLLSMATESSSSSAKRIKIGTTSNTSLDDVPVDVFINYIIPLIGDYPYCFVAIGIPNFRDAYVTMFPDETSYIEFATVKDA